MLRTLPISSRRRLWERVVAGCLRNRSHVAAASDGLFKTVMAVTGERLRSLLTSSATTRLEEANRHAGGGSQTLERDRRARRCRDAARIERLKRDLKAAQKNASDAVFAQVNAAEDMGVTDDNGNLQCDFHGVRAPEAKRIALNDTDKYIRAAPAHNVDGVIVADKQGGAVRAALLGNNARSLPEPSIWRARRKPPIAKARGSAPAVTSIVFVHDVF